MRIPTLSEFKALFRERPKPLTRGYRDIVSVGGANSDWSVSVLSEDSDVWQNAYLLTARVRDLARTNPVFQKYRDLLWANTFGAAGTMLRMKVKETEDRVVYSADEKKALVIHERRINRIRDWAAGNRGHALTNDETYRAFKLADALEKRDLETVLRGKAIVSIGAPDIYANQRIEANYTEWQRPEFCDARGTRSYNVIRQLRLWSAVRDGGFFIRMVTDRSANKFGFTLQLINDEWCDQFFNTVLPNGNVVRRGIEYQSTPWGIGKRIAFYFITRQPQDWQFSVPSAFNFSSGNLHTRVDASEIVHYIRAVDAEGTRPAPWVASVIPKARQLDQYELAAVIAAREEACKTGFFYSDVLPEGGMAAALPDPKTGVPTEQMAPGERKGLPWGIKYQPNDPTHPSGNAEAFRKMMLRSFSAGMPAADYSRLANDYEAINFSAGRLQALDTNETYKLLQANDIEVAEIPIFERHLENSLIFGALPLPLAKLSKFNRPLFQGRRWGGVDEVKEATASALRVANTQSSDQRECAERGVDFEEILIEKAEAQMLADEVGVDISKTVQSGAPMVADAEDTAAGETANPPAKPKPAAKNGKKSKAANGHRFDLEEIEA